VSIIFLVHFGSVFRKVAKTKQNCDIVLTLIVIYRVGGTKKQQVSPRGQSMYVVSLAETVLREENNAFLV
jgi:hypothetical protein